MRIELGSRRSWIILLAVVVLILGMTPFLVTVMPKRSQGFAVTELQMDAMKNAILEYARTQKHEPTRLEDLAEANGGKTHWDDLWGRPLLYRVDGNVVTITSLGRDGKSGGTGEDSDIIGQFELITPSGLRTIPIDGWSKMPEPWWQAQQVPATSPSTASASGGAGDQQRRDVKLLDAAQSAVQKCAGDRSIG
jgi:hypothetical protein